MLSEEELAALLERELAACPADVRDVFERFRVDPVRMTFARPTTLESAFVVARRGDEVLYYEEVEEGFNISPINADGRIADHSFAQDPLRAALWRWTFQTRGAARPAFTFFHVMWLVVSAGAAVVLFVAFREAGPVPRLLLAGAAFLIAAVVAHLLIVFVVTSWVIPRVTPDSYWSREVDGYMASVFPDRWGK